MKSSRRTSFTRRQFVKAGAAVCGTALLGHLAACAGGSGTSADTLPGQPDFLIILTDQTRVPGMHWPPGLLETMPSFKRLAAHGLTFTNAHCSSSMCGPSRACLYTGAYENVNGVQTVVSDVLGEMLNPASDVPNLASMLTAVGYDVVFKGKWDLVNEWERLQVDQGQPTEPLIQAMQDTYVFSEWNPPDSGIRVTGLGVNPPAAALATLGGGAPNNDGRYVEGANPSTVCQDLSESGTGCQTPGYGESVVSYLAGVASTPRNQRKPFCLIVSLTNPHDIGFYPGGYSSTGGGYPSQVPDLGVTLPDNFNDPLTTKPNVQAAFQEVVETQDFTAEQRIGYVNFYPNLYQVVDREIMKVLDALDSHGLTDHTIIFRTSDHGELALSHNLIEKSYSIYREVVDLPLIISNPIMFPAPQVTDAQWSHIDLTATIAELAGAQKIGVGVSQVPVLRNPKTRVRDDVVFFWDDEFGLTLTTDASHIRALINDRYSYGLYFTATYAGQPGNSAITAGGPYQLELYDNLKDPGQLTNLLFNTPASIISLWRTLHARLTASMQEMNNLPPGWPMTIEEIQADILPYGTADSAARKKCAPTLLVHNGTKRRDVIRPRCSGEPFRGWRPPET
ncbi:MAG TPA: sulfatase-like hydrolase/transferase [Candidatus Binataceae bacterium]|nr:sulfatase-like hydrolase/transferase [Candidatus Binataceae bacterium]